MIITQTKKRDRSRAGYFFTRLQFRAKYTKAISQSSNAPWIYNTHLLAEGSTAQALVTVSPYTTARKTWKTIDTPTIMTKSIVPCFATNASQGVLSRKVAARLIKYCDQAKISKYTMGAARLP